jgi:uncharacterized protein YaaN involved in tellurite resistance
MTFVASITELAPGSPAFERKVGEVTSIGEREIVAITAMSARFADRPDHAFGRLFEETAPVARSLSELRKSVERLNLESRGTGRPGRRRSVGILRRRRPLAKYLDTFAESEDRIRELIGTLGQGRSDLQQSNAIVDQEQRSLTTLTETLRQYANLVQRLDEAVEAAAAAIAGSDPERARLLAEAALFPIRRRRQDILTHLAVSAQGLAALAIVRSGNDQLIRAVDTVTTTTVAALRTAALVARALSDDREVAAQLNSVKDLAATVDTDAGAVGHAPGAEIAGLQRAWDEVFAALDKVDSYSPGVREAVGTSMRKLADPG